MTISTDQTQLLHAQYVILSGMDMKFNMHWHFHWEHWLALGFTLPDLKLVIAYLKRRIQAKRTPIESLKLSNLVGRTEKFSEDLAIAKAELRNFRPQSPRQKILTATGRTETPKSEPKSTREIIGGKDIETLIGDLRRAVV